MLAASERFDELTTCKCKCGCKNNRCACKNNRCACKNNRCLSSISLNFLNLTVKLAHSESKWSQDSIFKIYFTQTQQLQNKVKINLQPNSKLINIYKFNYGLYEKTASNRSLRRVFSQIAQRLNYAMNPLAVGC